MDLAVKRTKFLELLEKFDITVPTHVGTEEPIRKEYHSISEAIEIWGDPFLWRSAKTKTRGSVWLGRGGKHSSVFISFSPARCLSRADDLVAILRELGTMFEADLGYVHYTTDVEIGHPSTNYDAVHAVDIGVTGFDLRFGIPNACWAMFFGSPYSCVAECLSQYKDAGFRLDGIGQHAMLRINVPLPSLRSDYDQFLDIRNKIKQCVVPSCFGTKASVAAWVPMLK
jgi:hypothetical protein